LIEHLNMMITLIKNHEEINIEQVETCLDEIFQCIEDVVEVQQNIGISTKLLGYFV
jgi:hypothetical protein